MKKDISIRELTADDKAEVMAMMREFYDSPAVIHKSSDSILEKDFDDCISDMPFLRGFMLEFNGEAAGYAMTALGYTTEYGGICVWLEDLYHCRQDAERCHHSQDLFPLAVHLPSYSPPGNQGSFFWTC